MSVPKTEGKAGAEASAIAGKCDTMSAVEGKAEAEEGAEAARPKPQPASKPAASTKPKPVARNPYLRAANEDDDGYDPYSDRREEPPLFEPDPWS